MSSRADVAQVVLDTYDTFQRGEIEATLAVFHPDAVVRIAGDPAQIPFAGTFRGREGFRRFVALLTSELQWRTFNLDDLLIDGDRALVRWHAAMRVVRSGEKFVFHLADHIVMRDGLILAFDEWFDTAAVAELLGRNTAGALDTVFVARFEDA